MLNLINKSIKVQRKSKSKEKKLKKTLRFDYELNSFYVKHDNKHYNVHEDCLTLSSFEPVLYSLPSNNSQEEWSERTNVDVGNIDIVKLYWSKYKDGLKVKVKFINDKCIIL